MVTVYVVPLRSVGSETAPNVALNAGVASTLYGTLGLSQAIPSFTSASCSW